MQLSPELIQLIEAGFGVLFLFAIIILLRLAGQALKPFHAMTDFLKNSQDQLIQNQNRMASIIDVNTQTLVGVGANMQSLVNCVLTAEKGTAAAIQELVEKHTILTEQTSVGVLVNSVDMAIVLYSPSVLNMLGWDEGDLQSNRDHHTIPVLSVTSEPLPADRWPPAIALNENRPVENIPIQVYSSKDKTFRWVLVSAYPCYDCSMGENSERWATVIIRRLESLGRLSE